MSPLPPHKSARPGAYQIFAAIAPTSSSVASARPSAVVGLLHAAGAPGL